MIFNAFALDYGMLIYDSMILLLERVPCEKRFLKCKYIGIPCIARNGSLPGQVQVLIQALALAPCRRVALESRAK